MLVALNSSDTDAAEIVIRRAAEGREASPDSFITVLLAYMIGMQANTMQ